MTQQIEPRRTTNGGRVLDHVVAWTLYVIQLLVEAVLAVFALFSVFMTDSCGSVADEPAVCDTNYFGAVLFSYWAILAVAVFAVPVILVICIKRGKLLWPWALGALVVLAVLTALFVALMTR